MKQKSLKKNAILNMIKTLMSVIYPLLTFPYSSRILGPEGIGKTNFSNSIISYFSIIAGLGIGNYAVREAAKVRDNKIELSKFSKEILIINLISTFTAYVLFFIALVFIPKFNSYKYLLMIFSTTLLFNTIGLNWLYQAIEDYLYITVRTIAFQIVGLILLYTLVKTPDDIVKYAGLIVFSNVGSNILNFFNSRKIINLFIKTKIELKKHIKPIFILFATTVAVSIYTILDSSMLGFLTNDTEVGYYTAATKINRIVLSLVTSVSVVFIPRLSYYLKDNDKSKFYDLTYQSFDILFLFSIPCTFGLFLLSKNITLILSGELFLPSVITMKIMNPIIIIIGLSNLIGNQIFFPLKKEIYTLYSVLIGAFVNFTLNFILIPKYGAQGAAIATISAESCVTIFQLVLLKQFLKLKVVLMKFLKYLSYSIIMSIFVYFTSFYITNLYISTFLSIIVGITTYFLLLLLTKNEILYNIINSILKKLKKE